MKLSNFESSLLSSKGVVKTVQELPKLSAIEIVATPDLTTQFKNTFAIKNVLVKFSRVHKSLVKFIHQKKSLVKYVVKYIAITLLTTLFAISIAIGKRTVIQHLLNFVGDNGFQAALMATVGILTFVRVSVLKIKSHLILNAAKLKLEELLIFANLFINGSLKTPV